MTRTMWKSLCSAALIGVMFSPAFSQAQYQNDPNYDPNGQQQGYDQNGQDPPAIAARLTYEQGAVSLQTSGSDQWSDAGRNYPLTSGDRIYADNGARAEIVAGQTAVRLGSQTDLTITNLTYQLAQFGLAEGSVRLRTYGLNPQATVELDTPNGAVTVVRPGDVRVDAYGNDGGTVVTVNTGAVQISGPNMQQEIYPGQSVQLNGYDQIQVSSVQMPGYDDFDRFSIDRDRRVLNSRSAQYVSRDMVGYEDLDDHGNWDNNAENGPVWYPNDVPADWEPYHDGHWAYVQPWGWTWVDNAQWGFAPFHYGRWARYNNRWGWVPGPREVAPYYSPALVVFVGGIGIGIGGGGEPGFGGGNAAWFPLGVGEPFVPWYHTSPRYVQQVNVTNVNITNIHNTTIVNNYNTFITNTKTVNNVNNINVTNINYAHKAAVTAVPAAAFASGKPVAQAAVKVNPAQLQKINIVRQGPVAVKPVAAAVARPVSHPAPPVAAARPTVLTKKGPMVALPNAKPTTTAPAHLGEAKPTPGLKQPAPPKPAPAAQQNQNRPGQPNQPNQPNRPGQPGQPNQAQPARPGQPVTPAPARPGQPAAQPNQPNQPNRPGQPEANRPGQPNQPNQPNRPGQPEAQPNRPGQPPTAQPARPGQPEQNRPGQPNQPPNRPVQPEQGRPPVTNPQTENRNLPPNRPTPTEARPAPQQPARPTPQERPAPPAQSRPEAQPQRPQPQERPAPPVQQRNEARPAPPVQQRNEARPAPPAQPRPEAQPQRPQPQERPAPPVQQRNEARPAPPVQQRNEARPAPPAQQRNEARPAPPQQRPETPQERQQRLEKEKEKPTPPPQRR